MHGVGQQGAAGAQQAGSRAAAPAFSAAALFAANAWAASAFAARAARNEAKRPAAEAGLAAVTVSATVAIVASVANQPRCDGIGIEGLLQETSKKSINGTAASSGPYQDGTFAFRCKSRRLAAAGDFAQSDWRQPS
jgi:hypothetical protein